MEPTRKTLYRSRSNRMIAGVCAGLADFFNLDPTIVRLVFVLGLIFGVGTLGFVYLVMMLVVPEEPMGSS